MQRWTPFRPGERVYLAEICGDFIEMTELRLSSCQITLTDGQVLEWVALNERILPASRSSR